MQKRDFNMRFYRLEKKNYFQYWAYALFKGLAISLILTILLMIVSGYKFMIVSSGSMEPKLPVGSLVIVTPCDYEDLELNDIVTMDAGGINLTHRIVGKYNASFDDDAVSGVESMPYLIPVDNLSDDIKATLTDDEKVALQQAYDSSNWWVTKGDNSDTIDGALTDNIVGKVYEAHAFGWVGTVVRYVRANYIMLIIMLILLMAFVSVLEWLKNQMTPDDIEVYENDEDE